MRKVFYLMLIIAFPSCIKDAYQENLSKMDNFTTKMFEDIAFANNCSFKNFEITENRYDTINENVLDSIRISILIETANEYNKKGKDLEIKSRETIKKIRLYSSIEWNDLREISIKELRETGEQMKLYADSALYYINQTTVIEERIKNRNQINPILRYRSKVKCTFEENNSNNAENKIEYIELYFDHKTLERIEL